jgi:uncharacterized hydrophobic protein (TIGR00271 family)
MASVEDETEANYNAEQQQAANEEEKQKATAAPAVQIGENVVDIESMKDAVFFLYPDMKRRLSQFWMLIILASIIATSGVAGDSAATVIGAMIVAPLMTPILGTMLAIVLADRRNFVFSLLLVITGAGSAVLVGYLFGLAMDDAVIVKENNSQVAARVEPKLPDLVGALATGAVGSVALVRKDIAGTLPGVSIAISLVPPLCVAGLAFSTGDNADAIGALLLFATNFVSILFVGVIIMYFYKIHLLATQSSAHYRMSAFVILLFMLAIVATLLALTSIRLGKTRDIEKCLTKKTNAWAEPKNWSTDIVIARENGGKYTADIYITGAPPFPTGEDFANANVTKAQLCDAEEIKLFFIPERKIDVNPE